MLCSGERQGHRPQVVLLHVEVHENSKPHRFPEQRSEAIFDGVYRTLKIEVVRLTKERGTLY
jgi:uncharacterized protein (DUF952 family)